MNNMQAIARMGVSGTNGTLNPRSSSAWDRRSRISATFTPPKRSRNMTLAAAATSSIGRAIAMPTMMMVEKKIA